MPMPRGYDNSSWAFKWTQQERECSARRVVAYKWQCEKCGFFHLTETPECPKFWSNERNVVLCGMCTIKYLQPSEKSAPHTVTVQGKQP